MGKDTLPSEMPIFPLAGALLLPRGQLPLHIFEPRYVSMVEDALRGDRMIGMILPQDKERLYATGCAGRITSFTELENNRYTITLTGVSRFHIKKELALKDGYRRVVPLWNEFSDDLTPPDNINFDRNQLREIVCNYFNMQEMDCNWSKFDEATDEKIITCLSMICPFDDSEKQALIEARSFCERARTLITMIDIAVHGGDYAPVIKCEDKKH